MEYVQNIYIKLEDYEKNIIFRESCKYGHFDIAKWLYNKGNVNISDSNNYAFACWMGHMKQKIFIYVILYLKTHVDSVILR